ncbi:phage tail sheath family protein [Thiococcus pfennigii]|uniref:phage tail sheath family protein n=1 Tax=Thiococcus pfennigii TaxID=1057 RepID=UPI0019080BDE|nr:phage tail sheath subtilisin-like domain-containing protein [Thiococcus pfennigii]MBK1699389.1 hypothetical protein [Thiococcus pfennigii]
MATQYATPGVYIEEVTGPGVIGGVGTSTAAFIGPALNGPLLEARRITSFDEFLRLYALIQADGRAWPYIVTPRPFYLAHAVRGFFENAGSQAYVVRIGTGRVAEWHLTNRLHPDGEVVCRILAQEEGEGPNSTISVETGEAHATGDGGCAVATASSNVTGVDGVRVTVVSTVDFRVGDVVASPSSARAAISAISALELTLDTPLADLQAGNELGIANLIPGQRTFRVAEVEGLAVGSVVLVQGTDASSGETVTDYAIIETLNRPARTLKLASSPGLTHEFRMDESPAPVVISQEFRLTITAVGGSPEVFDNLSLDPRHPGYVFSAVDSERVRVLPPDEPPIGGAFPDALVEAQVSPQPTILGVSDSPEALGANHFMDGLNVLRDIDDVNIVCIPDAAAHPECFSIQQALIEHCVAMRDRVSVLDARPRLAASGPNSVEEQRADVESEGGFAALYYPWLVVRDPTSSGSVTRTITIPPCGHIAGVYARTDAERGVHKAPANTPVRGVIGLEQRLSDRQQGPLNLKGVNVLRIFPGSSSVIVWGARTTVDPAISDWLYVPVRRLMLFVEESIEEGIRWAVFEPNDLGLWQKLKRSIHEFLTRVWRDGALFGATAQEAFYVRVDEALNPPATRARGELYIEIGLAVVRPAEFIVVRIGLWDGGSSVTD